MKVCARCRMSWNRLSTRAKASIVAPKTALAPPSPEAKRQLAGKSIDLESGEVQRGGGITECFRVDAKGKIIDTQYRLISRESAYARGDREEGKEDNRAVRNREGSTVRVRSERAEPEDWGWSRDAWRGDRQWGSWRSDYAKPQ